MKQGLELLREPFPPHLISKLPKPTKEQTEEVKKDFKKGIRCDLCGAWHHPKVVHLDYVGHAALTDRLLDVDPKWTWEPMALEDGLPKFDKSGGLWIKLTILGHTRIGYGNAKGSEGKDPGAREKEVIGDALRNAAMRFGAALDLWHKGDLHVEDKDDKPEEPKELFQDANRYQEPKLKVIPNAASPFALVPPEKKALFDQLQKQKKVTTASLVKMIHDKWKLVNMYDLDETKVDELINYLRGLK